MWCSTKYISKQNRTEVDIFMWLQLIGSLKTSTFHCCNNIFFQFWLLGTKLSNTNNYSLVELKHGHFLYIIKVRISRCRHLVASHFYNFSLFLSLILHHIAWTIALHWRLFLWFCYVFVQWRWILKLCF